MQKGFLLFLLIITSEILFAQSDSIPKARVDSTLLKEPKFYIGFGLGVTNAKYIFEPSSPISSGGKSGSSTSINLSVLYSFNRNWLFESGVSLVGLPAPGFISQASGYDVEVGMILVPFRVNYKWNIAPNEIEVMAFCGYTQGIRFEQITTGFYKENKIDAYGEYYGKLLFPLADIGGRVKFPLGLIHLGLSGSYTKGFEDIYTIYIQSMPGTVGSYPNTATSKGTHFNFRIDAYYTFKRKR